MKQYIVEVKLSSGRWVRSGNRAITIPVKTYLDGYAFDNLKDAEREAFAQAECLHMPYRVSVILVSAPTKGIDRTDIYAALTAEDNYAMGWAVGRKSIDGSTPDHMVSRQTGMPFSEIEWINFAEKYLNEAKLSHANYLPDVRALHIRMLKAASLLVSALQVSVTLQELSDIAGVSSSKFPLKEGGLKTFQA